MYSNLTWLCLEGDRKCIKRLFIGLRRQCGSIGGVRFQACQPGGVGICSFYQSLVLNASGARTGPTSAAAASCSTRLNRSEADLVVARQTGQNGSPLERGGVSGHIADVDSLGSDDLCWRTRMDEVTVCARVC